MEGEGVKVRFCIFFVFNFKFSRILGVCECIRIKGREVSFFLGEIGGGSV